MAMAQQMQGTGGQQKMGGMNNQQQQLNQAMAQQMQGTCGQQQMGGMNNQQQQQLNQAMAMVRSSSKRSS
jgi:hypothetical protein